MTEHGETSDDTPVAAVTFDLFGTLVDAERPADPAGAVAAELERRGVRVPENWAAAYAEPHVEAAPGEEVALPEHVASALAAHTDVDRNAVRGDAREAVRAAFDAPVETRSGAADAVAELAKRVPVGVLSNCSVPGLAERALARSAVDEAALAAVTTSVDCRWRKPDERAFAAAADALAVDLPELVHVGDDPATDGGATDAGARAILLDDTAVGDVPEAVEGLP